MGNEDTAAFLREVPMLAGCGPRVLAELAAVARSRFLAAGTWLFRQDEWADTMAVVRHGRLEVVTEADGTRSAAGTVGRGAVLGEVALLAAATRAASVRAVRDCDLLLFHRDDVEDLLAREPAFALALARAVAGRHVGASDVDPVPRATVIALLPLEPGLPVTAVADGLLRAFRSWGEAACLDGSEVADTGPGQEGMDRIYGPVLDRWESEGELTLLLVREPTLSPWARFCLRSADRVVAVTRGGDPPAWAAGEPLLRGCDVAFVGAAVATDALLATLVGLAPRAHHLVLAGHGFRADVARLARRLTGRSVGLVLSGGGARGMAHVGVVEGLARAGVEVDRVGGCSMGAFVAALVAMGWEPERIRATCRGELVERSPFTDYTVSRVSLLRLRKAESMLGRVLGDLRMEELPRPLFTVSSDLATGETVVHRQGRVRQAVLASAAIPGLVPPQAHDGRLLVDGGLLDNLPVDVMAADAEGPIIAVDVMRRMGPRAPSRGRRIVPAPLAGRRHPQPPSPLPSIFETLIRASVLGSWQRAEHNRGLADLVVMPEVADIGLLDFDRFDRAVEAGRQAAEIALGDGLPPVLRP